MVKKNWPQIQAVASALLIHKRLDEDHWTIIVDALDEAKDWQDMLRKLDTARQSQRGRSRFELCHGAYWTDEEQRGSRECD